MIRLVENLCVEHVTLEKDVHADPSRLETEIKIGEAQQATDEKSDCHCAELIVLQQPG